MSTHNKNIYKENKYNYVKPLHDYMLTNHNIINFTRNINNNYTHNNNNKNNTNNKDTINNKDINNKNIFETSLKDTLFWCFYVIENSIDSYNDIDNKHYHTEHTYKISFIETIKNSKDIIKQNKLKYMSVEYDMTSSLNNKITYNCLKALCIMKNINIIILDKKCYYDFNHNYDNEIYVITYKNDIYTLDLKSIKQDELQYYRDNYLLITDVNKKLKGVSSYKLPELVDIAKKLDIDVSTKKTKTILYEEILNKI